MSCLPYCHLASIFKSVCSESVREHLVIYLAHFNLQERLESHLTGFSASGIKFMMNVNEFSASRDVFTAETHRALNHLSNSPELLLSQRMRRRSNR